MRKRPVERIEGCERAVEVILVRCFYAQKVDVDLTRV